MTPEFIINDSIESNPLLGIYAKQTLKSDKLSAADINDAGVGEKGSILKDNTDRTIQEFRSSSNPLIPQKVFSCTKRNLLEDCDTYSDEYILENTNTVDNLKSSRNRTEDESVEVAIKRVRKNKKQLINTKAIEHNNNVHMGNISNIDLNKF